MLLKLRRFVASFVCIPSLFLWSPAFSNAVYIDPALINFSGTIDSVEDDGSFTLDTTDYTLRLFSAKILDYYDVQRLVDIELRAEAYIP